MPTMQNEYSKKCKNVDMMYVTHTSYPRLCIVHSTGYGITLVKFFIYLHSKIVK